MVIDATVDGQGIALDACSRISVHRALALLFPSLLVALHCVEARLQPFHPVLAVIEMQQRRCRHVYGIPHAGKGGGATMSGAWLLFIRLQKSPRARGSAASCQKRKFDTVTPMWRGPPLFGSSSTVKLALIARLLGFRRFLYHRSG
jgi:hypothetical protein